MINRKKGNLIVYISLLVGAALMHTGCGDPLDRNMQMRDLDDPDVSIRIMAIKWASENKRTDAVPQLVNLLQNEDRSVRFYAIQGLKQITGTDNGFDYRADPVSRADAVKRWQKFIESDKQ